MRSATCCRRAGTRTPHRRTGSTFCQKDVSPPRETPYGTMDLVTSLDRGPTVSEVNLVPKQHYLNAEGSVAIGSGQIRHVVPAGFPGPRGAKFCCGFGVTPAESGRRHPRGIAWLVSGRAASRHRSPIAPACSARQTRQPSGELGDDSLVEIGSDRPLDEIPEPVSAEFSCELVQRPEAPRGRRDASGRSGENVGDLQARIAVRFGDGHALELRRKRNLVTADAHACRPFGEGLAVACAELSPGCPSSAGRSLSRPARRPTAHRDGRSSSSSGTTPAGSLGQVRPRAS